MTNPNETTNAKPTRRAGYFIYYFCHNPLGLIGLVIVVIMILTAFLSDVIARYDYNEQNYDSLLHPPSARFFFGTDSFGRDVFSRMVGGVRNSMLMALLSVLTATGVGAIFGVISGRFISKLDAAVRWLVDRWTSLPGQLLAPLLLPLLASMLANILAPILAMLLLLPAIVWVAFRGDSLPSYGAIIILGTAFVIMHGAVLVTHSVLTSLREKDHTTAARSIAIIPSMFGTAILMEVGFRLLGVAPHPGPSLGILFWDSIQYGHIAPWPLIFTSIFIFVAVLGFALFGFALRGLSSSWQRSK